MNTLSLFRRFIGSILDKMMILGIFVICFCIIEGDGKSTSRGLTYLSIGCHAPSEYSNITINSLYIIEYGYPVKYSHESEEEIVQRYEIEEVEGIVRSFDLTITFSFIFLNILYYLLSEIFLGVSLGKAFVNGRMVDNMMGEKITSVDAFKRAIIGGVLMSLAVGFRFLFDVNYIITIVLFFLIMDIPLFINRRSLLDILSKVTYIDRHPKIVKESAKSCELVTNDEKSINPPMMEEKSMVTTAQPINHPKQLSLHLPHITFFKANELKNYAQMKKVSLYVYIIWLAVNITALAYAMANPHMSKSGGLNLDPFDVHYEVNTRAFYPFESYDIGNYDFSEFVVYTIALPLCLFAIIKLILLFVPQKSPK